MEICITVSGHSSDSSYRILRSSPFVMLAGGEELGNKTDFADSITFVVANVVKDKEYRLR